MTVTRLFVKPSREADQDPVAVEDRLADLMLPILPGLKVLRVQPGPDSIPDKTLMKFADSFLVTMGIYQEDVQLLW